MERFRLFKEWALESLVRTVRAGRLLYFRGARLASKGPDNDESLYATLADLDGLTAPTIQGVAGLTDALAAKADAAATATALAAKADAAATATALAAKAGVVRQTFSNAAVTITAGTTVLAQIGTLTASRTVTLPAASAYLGGHGILLIDESLTVTAGNSLVVQRAGSDTVNNATSVACQAGLGMVLISDGTSKWTARMLPSGNKLHLGSIILDGTSGYSTLTGVNNYITLDAGNLLFGYVHMTTASGGVWNLKTLGPPDGIVLQLPQRPSLGTPASNCVRIGSKDVSGTAELFVCDEAGNETQISPHSATAPAWLYESGQGATEPVSFSWNCFTGLCHYQHRATGRRWVETLAEHNARLGYEGERALVLLDWDQVQAGHVAAREASRAQWQAKRSEWEQTQEPGEWSGGDLPEPYAPKVRPVWAVEADISAARREIMVLLPPQLQKLMRTKTVTVGGQTIPLKVAVEAVIAQIPDAEARADAEDWYNFLPGSIRRTNARVCAILAALGVSEVTADEWFSEGMGFE
jgi:hypothetical protein